MLNYNHQFYNHQLSINDMLYEHIQTKRMYGRHIKECI